MSALKETNLVAPPEPIAAGRATIALAIEPRLSQ
jgi:hypothetical protein